MLLLKTSGDTIGEVVKRAKHATDVKPNAHIGDLILISQTKTSLKPGQNSIRFIMTYNGSRLDTNNESKNIWGKKWKYMIDGYDVVQIPGFNIEDIQASKKNYHPVVTYCRLDPQDEPQNMFVLCPNHHTMFELGSARIDFAAKAIYVNKEKIHWVKQAFVNLGKLCTLI